MSSIALYGGTFDPVHEGHLKTAQYLKTQLAFDSLLLMPCKTALLKADASASPEQRAAMLQLAIQDYPELQLATWELERPGPTYTLDTLHFLRAEVYPLPTPLTIIMGADTFLQLPTWHDWSHLIQLAHFLVIYRETSLAFPLVLRELLIKHETRDPSELLQQSHGRIYCTHAGDYPIASRNIRQTIQQGDSPAEYLPPKVWEYIQKNGLYR